MEDTVVRKNSLVSIAAVLIVIGLVAPAAIGGMPWSATTSTTSVPTLPSTSVMAQPVLPSSQIAPLEHPVKYFAASMSELPIASSLGMKPKPSTGMVGARPTPPDTISLQTPVGPPSPELLISMAQMSERQGNIDQARTQYKQALAMWPSNIDVLRAAARMEDRLGKLEWAEYLYQKAAASNPRNASALNDLGLCLARRGRLEQSVQTIEQAIHLQPDKALYRNNAATVLVELRQDRRALAHLTAVHSPAEANYNMGQLLVQRGRAVEAEAYFVAALQQAPQMREAQVALARCRGGIDRPAPVATAVSSGQGVTSVEEGPQLPSQPGYQPTAQITPGSAGGSDATAPAYPTYLPPTYERAPMAPYATPAGSPVGAAPRHLPAVGAFSGGVTR
jgi:Tfp pilus assembly protein PilF